MGKPSVPTQKHLFALSGNKCAFRGCQQPLVDAASKKVTAKICHIKGNRPGAARHDASQTEEERQGFENLILMCPIHHDVIDADKEVYTVEILRKLKEEHEAKHGRQEANDAITELFLANVSLAPTDGSVILSQNQTGGQIAHTIHNNYGTEPQQSSGFPKELALRHLADVGDIEFAQTAHSKKLHRVDDRGTLVSAEATAIVFACSPVPLYKQAEEGEFLKWMDTGSRRYFPCTTYPFIPGPVPDRVGRTFLWNDGGFHGRTAGRAFINYLAVERSGFIEYGFCPLGMMQEQCSIYYAKAVAKLFAFLSFLRDCFSSWHIDPEAVSLGVAIAKTKGLKLECITERLDRCFMHIPVCDNDNFLYLRPAEPWDVNSVAIDAAESMLQHWAFVRPAWLETPEFEGGVYKGTFFRRHFSSW